MHALKNSDFGFKNFGEAYFPTIHKGAVKGWRKHTRMTINIVVPAGEIFFALYDDRKGSPTYGKTGEATLSLADYQRLTVSPGIWMAFEGMAQGPNLLMNIASIPHDPEEAENLPIGHDYIPFKRWV